MNKQHEKNSNIKKNQTVKDCLVRKLCNFSSVSFQTRGFFFFLLLGKPFEIIKLVEFVSFNTKQHWQILVHAALAD